MDQPGTLRVIADVHGEPGMLAAAAGDAPHIVLLGDLVDRGYDSPGVLRLALDWIESGRARLVRSNHDDKLDRALQGRKVATGKHLAKTLVDLDSATDADALKQRFRTAYAAAPFVIRHGAYLLVHGAVHPKRFTSSGLYREDGPERTSDHMALYGEIDGSSYEDGKPVRYYNWIDAIPAGYTALVGHDRRNSQTFPLIHAGAKGGRAIFLDTGCGKGGPLSFIDIPGETIGQVAPSFGTTGSKPDETG